MPPGAEATTREADPWGLVSKNDVWYLVAGTPKGRRTFRVDRILAAQVLDEDAQRPDGLDLGDEWDEVVTAVEARRSALGADIAVRAEAIGMLRHPFGRHAVVAEVENGWAAAHVGGRNADVLARSLAGFGGSVRVEGPPEVRARLLALTDEIRAANSHAAPPAPSDHGRHGRCQGEQTAQ